MNRNLKSPLPTLELFGNIEENFYQLGLKDRECGNNVHEAIRSMLKTSIRPLDKMIVRAGTEIVNNTILKNPSRYPIIKSYAEGMGKTPAEVYYVMLVPELVSAMTKWAPGLITSQLGCSSFFMRNQLGHITHGRILDFPLQGSYDQHERIIHYSLEGMPKIIGFNSAGIPYPSVTAFTNEGMTVALHQKFTNIFNANGESIFEIIFEMLKVVNDKKSAIEFLSHQESLTTWCLYMSFKNGDVLAYDIMGKENFYNEYTIDDENILYFCNHLENKNLNQSDYLPLGFHDYNLMREKSALQKINALLKNKNKRSDLELLKMMSSPTNQFISKNISEKKEYKIDQITASSLLAVTMNCSEETAYYINSDAPKIYQNNIVQIKSVFSHLTSEMINDKKYKHEYNDYHQGLHALMEAQKGLDNKNPHDIYHHLQFAIDHLDSYQEKVFAQFYFIIAQYIYETHPKVLHHLLVDLKELLDKLDGYLKEQCLIFIFRLEYILKLPITLELDLITNERLRDIIKLEMKIPRPIFHFTTRLMIIPRIDILDVIYVYTH